MLHTSGCGDIDMAGVIVDCVNSQSSFYSSCGMCSTCSNWGIFAYKVLRNGILYRAAKFQTVIFSENHVWKNVTQSAVRTELAQ